MNFLNHERLWYLPLALLALFVLRLALMRRSQLLNLWSKRDRGKLRWTKACYVLKALLLIVALGAGIVALARPSTPNTQTEFPAGTADVVVLLDVSRSMAATDCAGNQTRLKTAKDVLLKQVVPSLNNNQLGVITFAGKAAPEVFLTYETKTLSWKVEHELKISSVPGEGSAMGKAFDLAFRFFKNDSKEDRTKIILLFSDGGTDDNTDLLKISTTLRKNGIQLVVFALGQPVPAMIPVKELSEDDQRLSMTEFYKIKDETAKTALDERLLSELSKAAAGSYMKVGSADDARWAPLVSRLEMRYRVSDKEHFEVALSVFFVSLLLSAMVNRGERNSQDCVK